MALLALVVAALVAAALPGPAYTDAYYYFNAGRRLAEGEGLTDPYITLTYLNAPEALPAPSHTYWMPLASLVVTLAGGSFRLAQVFFVLMWVALAVLAFWLGAFWGRSRRHAWAAGLLAVFSVYYVFFLTTSDNFAVFGLPGALCLVLIGLGRARRDWRAFALAGALAGLAHLARADGLLLVGVLGLAALWPLKEAGDRRQEAKGLSPSVWPVIWAGVGGLAYLAVMTPWFLRNLSAVGTALPTVGTSTIWLRGYDEIASYPPDISPANFFAWGLGNIVQGRLTALANNAASFFMVQGVLVLGPFILIALWKRRRDPLLMPVWVYALLLHVVMTFVFAYPGYRGALFHSSTALLPWWTALGMVGLDDAVTWVAARRRHWRPQTASRVFTVGVVGGAVIGTLLLNVPRLQKSASLSPLMRVAIEVLPPGAVVMSNDPAGVYYHAGLPGVVVPDSGPEAVRAIAARYGVTHLVLDENRTRPLVDLYEGRELPAFLRPVEQDVEPSVRVFEVLP